MVKYNCLNKISKVGLAMFNDQYEQTEEITEADAILVRSAAMHEMDLPENLVAIARAGAGVNNIPLDKCAERGIVVFNTPGANANGVKELFISGLMMAARDIKGGMKWVEENKEDANINKTMEKAKSKFAGTEIQGKKLGVIGLGAIGVLVANAGKNLGMEVYGCDPYISIEHAWSMSRDIKYVKTREEIFRECDYITLHVPAMADTKGMINKDAIAMMKDGVVILNYARDVLVNDVDMAEALASGKVKKYITDFPNAATANMDGVVATPHLGASTAESEDNCAVMAVKEIMDYVENGNIKNSVNYPACDAGVCSAQSRITVNHKNIPNMISQLTGVFSGKEINIENMINKSRGEFAYSVFDIEAEATEDIVAALKGIDGVLRVRVVK